MGREKVVVIEDEPDILEVIVYNLQREGYTTFSAQDGDLLEESNLARAHEHAKKSQDSAKSSPAS